MLRGIDINSINQFRRLISPNQYSAKSIFASYIATKYEDCTTIYAGRIYIQSTPLEVSAFYLETESIIAGRFEISEIGIPIDRFIDNCCAGVFPTPEGGLDFWGNGGPGSPPNVFLEPIHEAGVHDQRRTSVLRLHGCSRPNPIYQVAVQWELRGAETPFDSLDELADELMLRGGFSADPIVEFVAFQAIAIAPFATSATNGQAKIVVHLAEGLDVNRVRLGIRHLRESSTDRYSIGGESFTWQERENLLEGSVTLDIGRLDIIQCFANYNDVTYSYYWVSDPSERRNIRASAISTFDKDFGFLKSGLFPDDGKPRSREFETAIHFLFWSLGFSVVQLDAPNGLNEAPDFLMTDDAGRLLVVECTTGRIGANDKLDKLAERHRRLERRLEETGDGHVETAAIIVTRLPSAETKHDADKASTLAVGVVAAEDLKALIERVDSNPANSRQIFDLLKYDQHAPK